MADMMRRFAFMLAMMSWLISTVGAQGAQADLLGRVNRLRQSQGLPGYTLHAALNAAAANHAQWLVRTGAGSHYQEDGSGPRARVVNAGYSSNWASENYYMGGNATAEQAWSLLAELPGALRRPGQPLLPTISASPMPALPDVAPMCWYSAIRAAD